MSVYPTTQHLSFAPARILAIAGTALASLAFTGTAAASTITDQPGNPRCAAGMTEIKLEPIRQGVTEFAGGTITVSDRTFSWATDAGVDAVIVKGGPNARIYTLDDARSGTGFRAPINPSNGQPYGLSHISFCSDGKTTPEPPKTCPEGTTQMSDGTCKTPDKPEPPKTCPEGTTQMSDGTCKTPDKPEPPKTCPEGTTQMTDGSCKPADPPKTPEPPAPCTPGGPAVMANGEPCVKTSSEPPVTVSTPDTPGTPVPPVVISVASRTEPGQTQVLGATGTVVAANAKMQGPKRCVARPFRQALTGRGIKKVTVLVNGKKVRTFTGARSSYAIKIDPRNYRSRVLRVTARVEYVAASGKKAQTLRMTVLRCAAVAGQQVRFAG